MRARNIKPGFFTNEILGTSDPIVCLLFAGLWCLADKEGRLEDRPLRIKAELFPYRDKVDVNGYLTVLERNGFVTRYSVGGVNYIQVESFSKHQTPHHTEKPRGYPAKPHKNSGSQRECVLTPLSNRESQVPERSDSLIPDSLIPDSISPSDLSSADAEDAGQQNEKVPAQAVVDLYNEVCGDLFPEVLKITDARRKAIKARWNFDTKNERESQRTNSLDYWRRYFTFCRTRVEFFRKAAAGENRGEHAGWVPGFDYLMRESTLLGVLEGKYK